MLLFRSRTNKRPNKEGRIKFYPSDAREKTQIFPVPAVIDVQAGLVSMTRPASLILNIDFMCQIVCKRLN